MSQTSYVTEDPFLERFLSRVPPHVAASFTGQQLAAIKIAFGGRDWGNHAVDIRFSFPLLWRRFYFVLLAGRERRSPDRRALERNRHPVATIGNALVSAVFFAVLAIPFLLAAYAFLQALGPAPRAGGTSTGLLADCLEQMRQLLR